MSASTTTPSESGALAAVFGTLIFFLIATVALGRTELFKKFDIDHYMSARNSQGSLSLVCSFFASGAGAWVLFTVPEAAILGGPIAVLGYAVSCIMPLLIFAAVGPRMRHLVPEGITFFEFVQARYGTIVNTYVSLIASFYMFLYLAAEFTSVGDCVTLLSGATSMAPIIGTSVVTLLYTTFGGLPVSLITDRVQGVGITVFTILICIVAFGYTLFPTYEPSINGLYAANNASANWRMVTSYGLAGEPSGAWSMAVVLILAVTSANLMHTGFQQRIWAAKDNEAVVNGLIGASLLTLPLFLVFGLFGMIAFANVGFGLVAPNYIAFLSAFVLVQGMPTGWQILCIIIAVMMVASSADTIQTGLSGLFHPIIHRALGRTPDDGKSPVVPLAINLGLTVVVNIVAISLAAQHLSVLSLFVLADLLCATCCVPVIMGLSNRIHPMAALAGCVSGLITALAIYGAGIDGELGNFQTLFAPGGLYANTSLYAFIFTPLVSGIVTAVVALPFAAQGYMFAGWDADKQITDTKGVTLGVTVVAEVESAAA